MRCGRLLAYVLPLLRAGRDGDGMRLKPCWDCGAQDRECFDGCVCAKCVDPEDYERWKTEEPEEYNEWLERERVTEYDDE